MGFELTTSGMNNQPVQHMAKNKICQILRALHAAIFYRKDAEAA